MARTLYLFSGLTPNIKGHPYFNIKVFSNYLNYLKTNFTLEKQINNDNYRINTGVIKITLTNYTGSKNLTYAVEVDSTNAETYHKCYFIDSITEQSGMLYLQTTIDYWGSYYLASNIDYLRIARCNRNVGIGVYDDIKLTKNENNPILFEGHNVTAGGVLFKNYFSLIEQTPAVQNVKIIENLSLVILLNYNVKQALIGDNKISAVGCFCLPLRWNTSTGTTHAFNVLDRVQRQIGGIYAIKRDNQDNDASILKAYIVPNEFIKQSNKQVRVVSKFENADGSINTSQDDYNSIINGKKEKHISLTDYDINNDYFAGTYKNKGLRLNRLTTPTLDFTYICDVRQDGLKISVKQGENEIDITDNFIIDIVGGTTQDTAIRSLAKTFSMTSSIVNSFAKGWKSGSDTSESAFNAFTKGGSTISNLISGFSINQNLIGNGDALSVYDMLNLSDYGTLINQFVRSPYCVNVYESIYNEKLKARYNGASFDEIIEDVNDVFDFDLLGEGNYTYTYIVTSEIKINNLPTIARNSIENDFASGVELFDYEGSTGE